MKKYSIIASSITLGIAVIAFTIVFLQPSQENSLSSSPDNSLPSSQDNILLPFLREPVVPHTKEVSFEKTVFPRGVDLNDMAVMDSVILPDETVISVGQIYTDREIFAPALLRTNLSGGVAWSTFINPVDNDDISYSAYGTAVNKITKVIYVNEDLVYAIGTIQASMISMDGGDYPLKGFFRDMTIPIGLDHLNFILSFSTSLNNFHFHGFITPPEEEGRQFTVIADATLIDFNTMVLTGVTNSHEGFFAGVSNKDPFDFVIKIDIEDTITLVDIFTFTIDTYVSPTKVYGLRDGDVIVMGNYQDRSGDFATIPLVQSVQMPGFVARLDGDTFTLKWVSSNLVNPVADVAVTLLVNALELTNHHVVTVANVWLANETNDRRVMVSVFDANGEVVSHQILELGEKVEAIRLFKATQGYWLIGTTYEGLDENLYLAKLSSTFVVERIVTLLGSNQDRFVTTPLVNNDLDFVFFVNTYSKDQDYLSLSTTTESSSVVFITLTASTQP
jgi:hypothetical protein